MTELDKFKMWEKRMNKIGPSLTGVLVAGFLLVVFLMVLA